MPKPNALLLAILIVCQAFYNAGVLGYWLTNRAYIATTLCENRDRPQLHCQGKCYLNKKLAATSHSPAAALPLPPLKKGLEWAEPLSIPALPRFCAAFKPRCVLPMQRCRASAGHGQAVFHPPALGC